jgi:hypothetical protein
LYLLSLNLEQKKLPKDCAPLIHPELLPWLFALTPREDYLCKAKSLATKLNILPDNTI